MNCRSEVCAGLQLSYEGF